MGDQHADYVAVAQQLRRLADEHDVKGDDRSKFMAWRTKREQKLARHYSAYGLRWAAQILEEKAHSDGSESA